jgi:hypothetical protein
MLCRRLLPMAVNAQKPEITVSIIAAVAQWCSVIQLKV